MLLMLCGNVILALSQWVLIAGLNYSNAVEEVGRYSYSLALAGLFLTVGQVGVRQYLMSTDIPISHVRQLYVSFNVRAASIVCKPIRRYWLFLGCRVFRLG